MQLSEDNTYTGGDLKIYFKDKTCVSDRRYGTITFFDSSYPHEVTKVSSGLRKSLVGWVLGPRVWTTFASLKLESMSVRYWSS